MFLLPLLLSFPLLFWVKRPATGGSDYGNRYLKAKKETTHSKFTSQLYKTIAELCCFEVRLLVPYRCDNLLNTQYLSALVSQHFYMLLKVR